MRGHVWRISLPSSGAGRGTPLHFEDVLVPTLHRVPPLQSLTNLNMRLQTTTFLLALACAAPAATAQNLLVVDTTNDKLMLLSDFDGSLINPAYADLTLGAANLPIEAITVGNEIWVSDQNADKLMRFSIDGTTYLGDVIGGMDNIRGLELVGNEVWVSNSGTNGGAPGDAVVRFSMAGVNLGFYPVNDPFDVVNYMGDVLIANIAGDDIDRHDSAGAFLGTFHVSDGITGIDFPEQLAVRSNGNVLAAGFITPGGVYEYDPTGAQINYWAVGTSVRGVAELGNGHILVADGSTLKDLDPVTGTWVTTMTGINARYITKFSGGSTPITNFCPGDGTGTACPCANESAVGADEGCLSSLGTGGKLRGSGSSSLSADTVVLTGTQMPNSSALYFQGTSQQSGGAGASFGDGLRCAGGTIVRLGTKANAAGASQYPEVGDPSVSVRGLVGAPGTRVYQVWYRNAAAFCTASTFNLSNGIEVTWSM